MDRNGRSPDSIADFDSTSTCGIGPEVDVSVISVVADTDEAATRIKREGAGGVNVERSRDSPSTVTIGIDIEAARTGLEIHRRRARVVTDRDGISERAGPDADGPLTLRPDVDGLIDVVVTDTDGTGGAVQ